MNRPPGHPLRRRLGSLLVILGAVVVAVPVGLYAYDEITYRVRMAQAPTPSPLMLTPLEAEPEGPPGGSEGQAAALPGPASPITPTSTAGSTGDPAPPQAAGPSDSVYQIAIPRIGVTYLVGEGVDNPVLDQGPGHYPQTVLPGEPGNAALAGHRTIRGRPAYFYRLDELEAGDEIHIDYGDRSLTFEVERVFLTSPYDLSVLAPTAHTALTLTTCDPPGSDEMRLIVQSRLVKDDET